jgi:steroid delta-isomerase-like uncharacterized protein
MSTLANKNLIRRQMEEVWNRHNADKLPDYWGNETLAEIQKTYQTLVTAFPDLHITIEDLIAEGDKVVVRTTITGTHEKVLQGLPPTHKAIKFSVIRIYQIAKGKIVQTWAVADTLGLLQQLGIGPTQGQPSS